MSWCVPRGGCPPRHHACSCSRQRCLPDGFTGLLEDRQTSGAGHRAGTRTHPAGWQLLLVELWMASRRAITSVRVAIGGRLDRRATAIRMATSRNSSPMQAGTDPNRNAGPARGCLPPPARRWGEPAARCARKTVSWLSSRRRRKSDQVRRARAVPPPPARTNRLRVVRRRPSEARSSWLNPIRATASSALQASSHDPVTVACACR